MRPSPTGIWRARLIGTVRQSIALTNGPDNSESLLRRPGPALLAAVDIQL